MVLFKKYWCHICKKDFSRIYDIKADIQCVYCCKTFYDILENEDISNPSYPIHFKPFVLNDNNTEGKNCIKYILIVCNINKIFLSDFIFQKNFLINLYKILF